MKSQNERNALIELSRGEYPVDKSAVGLGNYTYEETLNIDNSSVKAPVVVLNLTGFFYSGNISFIQFEGFRLKRVHGENKTISCYLCHVYPAKKIKYRVIERVDRNIDDIFYTEELVNFTDKNGYDETDALRILANVTDKDSYIDVGSGSRKAIFEDKPWNISHNFHLDVKISKDSDLVFMNLQAEKQAIEGYNTSWLWENSTFTTGKIPSDFHSPQVFDGRDGGEDCLSCHGINGLSAVSFTPIP